MPSQPPTPTERATRDAADAEYYRTILQGFVAQAADMARLIHAEAHTHAATRPEAAPAPALAAAAHAARTESLATAFDRIARTARRTILLARKIAEPTPAATQTQAQTPAQTRAAARRHIIRHVEDAIDVRGEGRTDALQAELAERLDAPEFEDDLATRPVADILKDLRRDLGLDPMFGAKPWRRRTPADIRTLCERAADDPAGTAGARATARLTAILGPPPDPCTAPRPQPGWPPPHRSPHP